MTGGEPVFRIVRGRADDVEYAAVVAVLLAVARRAARPPDEPAATRAGWDRNRRGPFVPAGSWRSWRHSG
ncbi:acyl-CoA carboxylase epsilon subunit [Actinomadura flavalba]|uniref:acyl-CoA carboxylase epsilon subunit n=1 Tax=Actinomadura flavalba TaxID=1120938 RepID=UPI00037AD5D3|nr:acyl-CoA carboxylase epsilon subunit [Actinomadura flavalba]